MIPTAETAEAPTTHAATSIRWSGIDGHGDGKHGTLVVR
jgi:hypothetical protein